MCTLIVLRQRVSGQALVVASNRDETLARPAAPLAMVETPAGNRFVAPRDLEAGGTWIGLNAKGLFVGLTNRPTRPAEARVLAGPPGSPDAESIARPIAREVARGGDPAEAGSRGVCHEAMESAEHRASRAASRAERRPGPDAARSRGLLVRDLLSLRSVAEVREALADVRVVPEPAAAVSGRSYVPGGPYRPFHLVAADDHEALRATFAEEVEPEIEPLGPGVHVVCNRDASDRSSRKVGWIRGRVEAIDATAPLSQVVEGLTGVLRAHPFGEASNENPCVHLQGYGTRSSTVIAVSADRWRAWHAEGPPCRTPYENNTRLLERIRQENHA